ncbi:MAG: family 78 glycoside hydrolase catalytic domain, partial [Fimbriimonadaceae bacterium]
MGAWDAQWISYNGEPKDEIGFFAFRRSFELDSVPSEFICRVSADQRYKLFVNGELVSLGPQRGDLQHYFYDTLDLAAHLGPGKNWIAAFVWNFGESAPIAQHTHRLGFVLEGPGVSTGAEWQVARLPGLDFKFMVSGEQPAFYAVGPGEIARFADMAWGWATGTMWPAEWQTPFTVGGAYERGAYPTGDGGWWLVPRSLPPMLYQEFAGEVQEVDPATNARKPLEPKVLTRGESLIVDFGELLCGYMRVRLSAQPGTKVEITYAEAPMDPQTHEKGDRNDLKGKQILGLQDRVVTDGKMRTFEPAWWRTCRYLKVESSGLIELESIGMMETGYPLREQSSFTGDDAAIEPLWDVSVRTARRCAGETYFDCPYYEQLQYAGDTRLQALIGYYLSSDRALQRAAIESFAWSALPEGLTQSRYPSRHAQVIPPFSLWWIMMLYDKWLYDPEPPAEKHLELAHRILAQWRKLLKGDPERA